MQRHGLKRKLKHMIKSRVIQIELHIKMKYCLKLGYVFLKMQ